MPSRPSLSDFVRSSSTSAGPSEEPQPGHRAPALRGGTRSESPHHSCRPEDRQLVAQIEAVLVKSPRPDAQLRTQTIDGSRVTDGGSSSSGGPAVSSSSEFWWRHTSAPRQSPRQTRGESGVQGI